MKRQSLVFAGPQRVEIVDEPCPAPGPGELLVRTRASAISAGTELLAFRGQLPPELPLDETLPALAGAFDYPFRYGYAAAGTVVAGGPGVDGAWIGQRVFAFHPHASAFVARVEDVLPLPADLSWEAAPLYASQETAVNLVLDAGPRLGERAVVIGQGVVGLLTTALLARFPLSALVAIDPAPARAARALRLGAGAVVASEAEARASLDGRGSTDTPASPLEARTDGADLTFELSGNPAALDLAIRLTGREGRVVIGSFYGDKRAALDLGGHFHRGRLTLISSQVSRLAPALSARWDRRRRSAETWRALAAVEADALVTHRFPLARASEAYQLLDGGPSEVLQVLLVYPD